VNGDALIDGSEIRVGVLPDNFNFAQFAANPAEVGKAWKTLGTSASRALFGQPGRFAASVEISEQSLAGRRLYIWILRSKDGQSIRSDYGNVSAHALLTSSQPNWLLPSPETLPPNNTTLLALGEAEQIFVGVKTATSIKLANATIESPGLTYDSWALLMIGNGDRSPSADIDSDGLVNLLEFVIGGDPLRADTFNPVLVAQTVDDKTYLEMSFVLPRNRLGVSWVVEASGDLKTWSVVSNVTITDQGDGTNLVVARDSVAAEDAESKRFMRIHVIQ
jgi:hypothetical protein